MHQIKEITELLPFAQFSRNYIKLLACFFFVSYSSKKDSIRCWDMLVDQDLLEMCLLLRLGHELSTAQCLQLFIHKEK